MEQVKQVHGLDKVVMNGLFVMLLLWASFVFTNANADPGFAIRHVGISIFCGAYISYFFFYKKYNYKWIEKHQVFSLAAFALFALTGLISACLGVVPKEGVFTTLINFNFLILLIVSLHAFREGLKLSTLAVVISIIGCASGLFGIFQFFDLVPKELIAGSPPTALQFNRNFFGSSQILILPFALIGFLSSSGSKRYIHLISISLIVWSITISQTRSAVLSLLIFGLVVLATLAIRYLITNPNRVKSTIFGFSLAVFVAGGGFLGATYFDNVSRDVSRYFKSERADRRQTSIEERLTIWKGSLDMIKSNPIIGVGFGHWRIHYAGNSNQPTRAKSGRAVISKAHNVYLEVLAETGIVGFLFYSMFLLGLSLIILKTGIHDKYGLVLSAGFLAYLSDYFFSFGNYQPSHMAYAGILLAYIIHLSDSETGRLVTRRSVLVVGGLMTFVALIATYWSLTFLFFDQNMSKGQKNSSQGDYETALYYFNNAANSIHLLNRAGDSPHLQKALVYNKMKRFDTAIGELRQAWPDNPYSPRLNATFGTSYFQKKDLEKASYYYQNAFDVQSRNLAIAEKLAICYFDMKRFRKCVEILSSFEKELNPNLKLILQISRMNSGQWAIPKE